MKTLKKFFVALRDNTDDARKKALIAIGTPVAAFVAGVVLTKLNEDRVDILVINETKPVEEPVETPVTSTEF